MSRPKQITSVTTILFLSLSLAGTSALLALALFTSVAEAKPASVLLQEGLYAEQIEGNLDSAIKIYEQVIAEAKAAEQTAAQATYRIGMCYLKKGEKDRAAERFAQVSSRFPEQQDLTAKAQEQLEKIAPPTHQAELPPEVMMYIVGLHMESYAKARSLNIPANTRVYGVDDSFNLYNGGILTIKNETGQTWTGEAPVGGFSYSNLDVYNEQGEKQKTRMVRRRAGRGGRYQLLWTLDRPIEPGEMRTLGWRVKGAAKLPQEGPPGSSYHSLNMNNHYGPEVLENFFLVIPFNVAIKEQSKEYISHKRIGIFDIYQWQSRVPADTVNTVDVVLTPGPIAPAQQFSPVIERVVHSLDENPEDSFIDFDTGQLFTPPKHLQGSQADKELKRWIAAKGIDAGSEVITAEGQVADSYLRGRDMAVLSLPQEQWDTMSPVSLQEHVAGVEAKFGRGLRGGQLGGDAWNSKTTFGFKTSEGGVGLLQIMGVTDSKDSLKIRYKMLQKAVEPAVAVKRRIRGVFLPECDRTTFDLLDLASGDLVNSEPCGQMLDLSDPAGRGNIYYDKSDGQHWLVGIRGTRLRQRIDDRLSSPEPDRLSRGVAAYYAIRSLPCQYEVTTGTGDKYELKVLSTDAGADGGARIHFEYWKTAEAPAAVAGFGPVIERVIYQGGSPHDCLIDFETGKLFKVPEPLRDAKEDDRQQVWEWINATGADAAGDTEGNTRGLQGFPDDMVAAPAPGGWDESPDVLVAMMRTRKPGRKARMFAKSKLPTNYYFKTREANMGVLQILGFTGGEPRGVRFRYKMLQDPGETVALGAEPSDSNGKKLFAIFVTCGTTCDTIEEALEKGDIETAKALSEQLTKLLPEGRILARGTPVESAAEMLVNQFELFHKALKNNDIERARTLMAAMQRLGGHSYEMFKRLSEASQAPASGGRGDPAKAVEFMPALYALFQGAYKAVDGNDFGTALMLTRKLLEQRGSFEAAVRGTAAQAGVEGGFETVKMLADALEKKDAARTRSLLEGLNSMGPALQEAIEKEAKRQQKPDPAKAKAAVSTLEVLCRGINEANDTETAVILVDRLIKQGRQLQKMVEGTTAEAPTGALLEMLPALRDALEKKQMDRAKTLYDVLGKLFLGIQSALKEARDGRTEPRQGPQGVRRVFLPDADTPGAKVVLDLAGGELMPAEGGEDALRFFRELGKGDLVYDDALICIRAGKAMWLQGGEPVPLRAMRRIEDSTAYKLPTVPCRLLVTTAEGAGYEVTVLSTENGGINLEYKRTQQDQRRTGEEQVGVRRVFLLGADISGGRVILDLATGDLLAPGKDGNLLAVSPTGKGDLAYDNSFRTGPRPEQRHKNGLACLRGARARLLTNNGRTEELKVVDKIEDATAYALPGFPCRLLVTTREGDSYDVSILSADGPGLMLEYKLLEPGDVEQLLYPFQSAKRLKKLGQAVVVYANEHKAKLPDTLRQLRPYIKKEDFQWIIDNVEYLGKGKSVADHPETVIAYDKTLLEKGNRTTVVYMDTHVDIRQPEDLEKLGIGAVSSAAGFDPVIERGVIDALEAARKFLAAVISGDEDEAIKYARAGTSVAEEIREFPELADASKLQIVKIHAAEEVAYVITSAIHDDRDRMGHLLLEMVKPRGIWVVSDVDFETPEGLQQDLKPFFEQYPNARTTVLQPGRPVMGVLDPWPTGRVFLPDVDTPDAKVVLDLGTGEVLPAGRGSQQLTIFRDLGKGDLAWDRVLICLRGGSAKLLKGGQQVGLNIEAQREDLTAYRLDSAPCRLLVTTTEGDSYEVIVFGFGDSGIILDYERVEGQLRPMPRAPFGPARKIDVSRDDSSRSYTIDFETGKALRIPQMLRTGSAEDALWRWLADSGLDAFAGDSLTGVDMAIQKLRPAAWEQIRVNELKFIAADAVTMEKGGIIHHHGIYPPTYAFRTRENGAGILQILDITKKGITVLYRMAGQAEKPGQVDAEKLASWKIGPLPKSPNRKLVDAQTLKVIESEELHLEREGLFAVEELYEAASESEKQNMIKRWIGRIRYGRDDKKQDKAAAALGNVAPRDKEVVQALIDFISQTEYSSSRGVTLPSPRAQAFAARALGRIGDLSAVVALIERLDWRRDSMRNYVKVALAEITGVYFAEDKDKWLKWWQETGVKKLKESNSQE